MPVDYYPQKSVADLLAILDTLQKRQVKGGITEVLAAGVKTTREFGPGNSRAEKEILRVMYSMHLRDPNTYDDPYASRIRRTRARYTFS
jgi:hypothetical protein